MRVLAMLTPNREDQNKKTAEQLMYKQQNSCIRCHMPKLPIYLCTCGGMPSGGSGDGGEEKASAEAAPFNTESSAKTLDDKSAPVSANKIDTEDDFAETLLSNEESLEFDSGLVSVESDSKNGKLVIQSKGGIKDEDRGIIRDYLNKVKDAFMSFKKSAQNFEGEIKDNGYGLVITIAKKPEKHFEAFLRYLDKQHLLPRPSPGEKKQEEVKEEMDQAFHPTPLKTKYKPISI